MCYQKLLSQLHGIGWFATTNLCAGTSILYERGIFHLPNDIIHDDEQLLSKFHGKSQDDQDRLLTLSGGLRRGKAGRVYLKHVSTEHAAKWVRTICMRNCHVEKDGESVTLYPEVARLNHSCAPNAEVMYEEEPLSVRVIAIRDIRAGEEVTISYCLPYETHRERNTELRSVYSFRCTCKVCIMCLDCTRRSDTRRLLLSRGSRILSEYHDAEAERSMPLSTDHDLASAQVRQRRAAAITALRTAKQMEAWVSEEDIVCAEVTKIWRQGWSSAWYLSQETDALYFIRKLIEHGLRFHMVDEEKLETLRGLMAYLLVQ